ncbi:uncharacterized protein LOC143291766 isoform X2 [Babylonia areolata]|uniref:uncharacterized protein LOC143291766 isoform X2 n=1 Tax=Babylonia areolata TaxID=304850 RepID=UPI003FD033FF
MEIWSAVSSHKPLILLVVLVMMLMMTIGGTDGAVTCTAKTTTSKTYVTCDFGKDISETHHHFNIRFHYPDIGSDSETKLMCNWVTADKLQCSKSKGVHFDNVVSDRLTFTAPPAVDKVGGKYVCQMVPSSGIHVQPCDLTYSDESKSPETLYDSPDENYHELARQIDQIDAEVTWALVMSFVMPCVFVIVVVATFLVVVCVRYPGRLSWLRRAREGPENGEVRNEEKDIVMTALCPQNDETEAAAAPREGQGPPGDVKGEGDKMPRKKRWSWNLFRRSRDDVEKTGGSDQPLLTMTESTQQGPPVTREPVRRVSPKAVPLQQEPAAQAPVTVMPERERSPERELSKKEKKKEDKEKKKQEKERKKEEKGK